MWILLKSLGLSIHHGFTAIGTIFVYENSGPFSGWFCRVVYQRYYDYLYTTPDPSETWGGFFGFSLFYMPNSERASHYCYPLGEKYGPYVCATLAGWLIHALQNIIIDLISWFYKVVAQIRKTNKMIADELKKESIKTLRALQEHHSRLGDTKKIEALTDIIDQFEKPATATDEILSSTSQPLILSQSPFSTASSQPSSSSEPTQKSKNRFCTML